VAEYFDSIRQLTCAAVSDVVDREERRRLADLVLHMQRRLENEVGHREPSVRELFRTASMLATREPIIARSRSVVARGDMAKNEASIASSCGGRTAQGDGAV
jgi:hypothetical protein